MAHEGQRKSCRLNSHSKQNNWGGGGWTKNYCILHMDCVFLRPYKPRSAILVNVVHQHEFGLWRHKVDKIFIF